jgi:hypothetical protein
MKLHENRELFQDAILAASQRFKLKEIYIEKDYRVTVALPVLIEDISSLIK